MAAYLEMLIVFLIIIIAIPISMLALALMRWFGLQEPLKKFGIWTYIILILIIGLALFGSGLFVW